MGKSGRDMYFSVSREQEKIKRQSNSIRERVKRLMRTQAAQDMAARFKEIETSFSKRLFLSVDLIRILGHPDPNKYSKRSLFCFNLNPPKPGKKDFGHYTTLVRRICIFLSQWPPWSQVNFPNINRIASTDLLFFGADHAHVDPVQRLGPHDARPARHGKDQELLRTQGGPRKLHEHMRCHIHAGQHHFTDCSRGLLCGPRVAPPQHVE
jgi:hypothetical protein